MLHVISCWELTWISLWIFTHSFRKFTRPFATHTDCAWIQCIVHLCMFRVGQCVSRKAFNASQWCELQQERFCSGQMLSNADNHKSTSRSSPTFSLIPGIESDCTNRQLSFEVRQGQDWILVTEWGNARWSWNKPSDLLRQTKYFYLHESLSISRMCNPTLSNIVAQTRRWTGILLGCLPSDAGVTGFSTPGRRLGSLLITLINAAAANQDRFEWFWMNFLINVIHWQQASCLFTCKQLHDRRSMMYVFWKIADQSIE